MQKIHPGTLELRIISAQLFRDTELFGKMDPFAKISIGSISKKTPTHNSGGKNPRWNYKCSFKILDETMMKI